jgi:hypothetical protein
METAPDIANLLKAAGLAWQLANPGAAPDFMPLEPALTARPTAPHYAPYRHHSGGHGHQEHAPGSRVTGTIGATTSTSSNTISYVVAADPTEYIKDAVSDEIAKDIAFIAGRIYRPYRIGW